MSPQRTCIHRPILVFPPTSTLLTLSIVTQHLHSVLHSIAMPFDLPPLRIALYFSLVRYLFFCLPQNTYSALLIAVESQILFSVVLFGLTAARLHYTTHLPKGDPLNGGNNFYGQSAPRPGNRRSLTIYRPHCGRASFYHSNDCAMVDFHVSPSMLELCNLPIKLIIIVLFCFVEFIPFTSVLSIGLFQLFVESSSG